MKILVTGSAGQLGTDVVAVLSASGHEVFAFTSVTLDITDGAAVSSSVAGAAPDVIVNCAAYTGVDTAEKESGRAYDVNCGGVRNLAVAAKEAGAALIHISTDFVFDGLKPFPYTEDDATAPIGVYGKSKLEGEEALRGILPEHIIIRTSWLYGAFGNNFVSTMLRLAGTRASLGVVYDQTGSPTWTKDLAKAVAIIADRVGEKGAGATSGKSRKELWGTYCYANQGIASWYDLAVTAIEEARLCTIGDSFICTSIKPIRTVEYPTPAVRPAYSVLDTAKIKRVFGIGIPYWRESLKKMIKELESIKTEGSVNG